MPKLPKKTNPNAKLGRLQRLSLYSFSNPRKTALLWLVVAVLGASCYGTFLKREGFPAINTPFAIANGSYLANDPAKVDKDVAKPLSEFLLKQDEVKSVQTQSFGNFYNAQISYKDGIDAKAASNELSREITAKKLLPEHATLQISPFEFGFTPRGDDLVIAFYSTDKTSSTEDLVAKGQTAAAFIKAKNLPLVEDVSIINPFEKAENPLTGAMESNQLSFDRFGTRQDDTNKFYNSVVVGVQAEKGADNLELDAQVASAVASLNQQSEFNNYKAEISGSFAPQINEQVSELQTSLLEGLVAVLIVGSIVIAIRASLLTVLSMVSVIAIVNGLLYLFGYSLNTITLFALILGLSLIVDDTIIMVEALDAQRRKQKDPAKAVTEATRKVSRAMIAATSTSVLSFAPLLFVGGILGGFIRAIPVTIIASLITSLVVALVFIPFFARFLILTRKQMGNENVHELSAGFEAAVARFISGPMLWAKGSTKKLIAVGIVAVIVGFGFVAAGGALFSKVTFNIFPPSKDGNQIMATITYKSPQTTIDSAQKTVDEVDDIIGQTVGTEFVRASYYGQADVKSATLNVDITDYKQRSITAPTIVDQLNAKFENFQAANVEIGQVGAGPPAAAFTVQVISSTNREAATKLAEDIASFVRTTDQLKRADGSKIKLDTVTVGNPSIYTRDDDEQYIPVSVTFKDTDTSALVTVTQAAIKKEFTGPNSKGAGRDLPDGAISFNAGQEDENQDSFKTLALAFPALLVVIYIVLAFQFRSLLQPILIFTALPFSLFGITLGLFVTDNPFSFFAMLGFFALIGLSIKNTILLTDYANQARKAGMHPVDAAHEALAERFRPLIATSLTAVFSLIPLAISSPFWEGLSVVLIGGLLSSTFLVVTVFPYYYLGAEFLRLHINRRTGLSWFVLTIALVVAYSMFVPKIIILAPVVAALIVKLVKVLWRRRKNKKQ